jgi:hypothetical protein
VPSLSGFAQCNKFPDFRANLRFFKKSNRFSREVWLTSTACLQRRTEKGHVLYRLPYAESRQVVVVAELAERRAATLRGTIRANGSATIGALGDSQLVATRSYITVAGYVLDLTEPFHTRRHTQPSLRLDGLGEWRL